MSQTSAKSPESSSPPEAPLPRSTPAPSAVADPTPVATSPSPVSVPTPAVAATTPAVAAATPGSSSYVAPAPGVKHVRAAYAGKGWAPPQKEYHTTEKRVGDKTRIEIQDEWDDDGNLRRTTVKHIITPDWKKKTEKTIDIIPAAEAEKMGLGKKK